MSKRVKADKHATLTVPNGTKMHACMTKWIDASFYGDDYYKMEQIKQFKPIITYTVGFLLYQDENITILACQYLKDFEKYGKISVIPTSLIVQD